MIRNFNYVFSFLILFFVFQVNANQCNEELVKDLPPHLPTSHYTPEELKQYIDQGLDKNLYLLMDENINLYIESSNIYSKHWNFKSQTLNENLFNKDYEVFEKQNSLNNISLPCNQKKKIVDQAWEDHDNMNTPGYYVRICDENAEYVGEFPTIELVPKRKLKYLNPRHKVARSHYQCK